MHNVDKEIEWIREGLINGSITVESSHDDRVTRLYNQNKFDELFCFLKEIFSLSISIKYIDNYISKLKNGELAVSGLDGYCSECGELISYSFNGKVLKPFIFNSSRERVYYNCEKLPNESNISLKVPSGEIFCNAGLPFMLDILEKLGLDEHKTVCSTAGRVEYSKVWESLGVFHIFVGNTSPSLWFHIDKLAVGSEVEVETNILNGEDYFYTKKPLGGKSKLIAETCTDLWWVSIVDTQVYKELLLSVFGEEGIEMFDSIDLERYAIPKGKLEGVVFNKPKELIDEPTVYGLLTLVK